MHLPISPPFICPSHPIPSAPQSYRRHRDGQRHGGYGGHAAAAAAIPVTAEARAAAARFDADDFVDVRAPNGKWHAAQVQYRDGSYETFVEIFPDFF